MHAKSVIAMRVRGRRVAGRIEKFLEASAFGVNSEYTWRTPSVVQDWTVYQETDVQVYEHMVVGHTLCCGSGELPGHLVHRGSHECFDVLALIGHAKTLS